MAARRSKEDIIKELEAKIQKLKERASVDKEVKITKDSAGIAEAISAIENAATENNIAVSEVIKAIARIKRTGLKIEDSARKAK
ncbi:MAG: hypothetical protein WCK93_09390 [Nitrosomonadales bacterium]|jgi:hypothetical protein